MYLILHVQSARKDENIMPDDETEKKTENENENNPKLIANSLNGAEYKSDLYFVVHIGPAKTGAYES